MSDSEGGGVIQPLAKGRVGRHSATSSVTSGIYHPSKSQLIDWVNQTLMLGITRLEEVRRVRLRIYDTQPLIDSSRLGRFSVK